MVYEQVYNALKGVSNLKVYKKAEIPDRYQLKRHYRVAPIVAEAQEGYLILKVGEHEPWLVLHSLLKPKVCDMFLNGQGYPKMFFCYCLNLGL